MISKGKVSFYNKTQIEQDTKTKEPKYIAYGKTMVM